MALPVDDGDDDANNAAHLCATFPVRCASRRPFSADPLLFPPSIRVLKELERTDAVVLDEIAPQTPGARSSSETALSRLLYICLGYLSLLHLLLLLSLSLFPSSRYWCDVG